VDTDASSPGSHLAAAVVSDVDVQTILVAGTAHGFIDGDIPGLEDRDTRFWDGVATIGAGSYDAVVVGDDGQLDSVVAARYYVYVADADNDRVEAVAELLPNWQRTSLEGVVRWDSHTGGYRVRSDDHPLR
jgi:hypothetical protein